jgi:hypothetical protein
MVCARRSPRDGEAVPKTQRCQRLDPRDAVAAGAAQAQAPLAGGVRLHRPTAERAVDESRVEQTLAGERPRDDQGACQVRQMPCGAGGSAIAAARTDVSDTVAVAGGAAPVLLAPSLIPDPGK